MCGEWSVLFTFFLDFVIPAFFADSPWGKRVQIYSLSTYLCMSLRSVSLKIKKILVLCLPLVLWEICVPFPRGPDNTGGVLGASIMDTHSPAITAWRGIHSASENTGRRETPETVEMGKRLPCENIAKDLQTRGRRLMRGCLPRSLLAVALFQG